MSDLAINGLPKDEPFPRPDIEVFESSEYYADEALEELAQALIAAHPRFGMHKNRVIEVRVRYLWQKKAGKNVLGWCSKANGMTKFFTGVDFVIGIAWEAAAAHQLTNHQMEALMFHELCHTGYEITKSGKVKFVVMPHDVEMFGDEVRHFGLWKDDLRRVSSAFEQAALVDYFGSDPVDREPPAPGEPTTYVTSADEGVTCEPAVEPTPESPPSAPTPLRPRHRASYTLNGEEMIWNEEAQAYYGKVTGERFEGMLAASLRGAAIRTLQQKSR